MKIAIATMKRLPIKDKRFIRHKVHNSKFVRFPERFNKKMHTLVYDIDKREVEEVQMRDLTEPFNCVFVTKQQFLEFILNGTKPPQLIKTYELVRDSNSIKLDNSDYAASVSSKENDKSISYHANEKPMFRKELKKLKHAELLAIATKRELSFEKVKGRITKQVIIDAIVDKSRKSELEDA